MAVTKVAIINRFNILLYAKNCLCEQHGCTPIAKLINIDELPLPTVKQYYENRST